MITILSWVGQREKGGNCQDHKWRGKKHRGTPRGRTGLTEEREFSCLKNFRKRELQGYVSGNIPKKITKQRIMQELAREKNKQRQGKVSGQNEVEGRRICGEEAGKRTECCRIAVHGKDHLVIDEQRRRV